MPQPLFCSDALGLSIRLRGRIHCPPGRGGGGVGGEEIWKGRAVAQSALENILKRMA